MSLDLSWARPRSSYSTSPSSATTGTSRREVPSAASTAAWDPVPAAYAARAAATSADCSPVSSGKAAAWSRAPSKRRVFTGSSMTGTA